jgi:Major Facilitator Superfamily
MSYAGHPPATPSNPSARPGVRTGPGAELRRQLGVYRIVFTNPDLRAAQVPLAVSKTVDLAQLIGLSTYLFDIEGVGAVAVYGVVRAIAPTVGVPLVTTTTSRIRPGTLLMWLGIAAAIATTAITTAVALEGPVLTVIILAGILHVILGAHRPITSALMPTLVGTSEELLACTAVTGLLDGVTFLAGPLLAGLLLVATGPAAVLYATAVLHAIAALLSARLSVSGGPAPVPTIDRRVPTARAFMAMAEVRVITMLVAAQTFVRGALNVIVVVFAIEVAGLDGSAAGLLLAAIGVGALLGMPIAYALTGRRLYRALGLGLLLWGVPVAIASVTPSLVVVLLLFAVIGLGNDLVDLGAFSALPRVLPSRVLPQVLGVFEAALQLGTALGAAAAGLLLGVAEIHVALLVIGSVLPIAVLLAARRLRAFDTRLRRRDDDVDLLRLQPTFARLPVQALDAMAAHLSPAEFTPGQTITVGGLPVDRYVLVARGEVLIERAGVVAARRQVGDAFGEIEFDAGTTRAATVRTLTARAATAVSARTIRRDTLLSTLGYDLDADVCTPIMPWRPPDRAAHPARRQSRRPLGPTAATAAGVPVWSGSSEDLRASGVWGSGRGARRAPVDSRWPRTRSDQT